DEAVALARGPALADVEVALLMSHLVSAEEPENPFNARQIAVFDGVRTAFPGLAASLANSSGLFLTQAPRYDVVRPGYALYGG
ncbi:alanine racemase, partial [Escherichia coli]|nr:alanine racemase [Escherichia coli]